MVMCTIGYRDVKLDWSEFIVFLITGNHFLIFSLNYTLKAAIKFCFMELNQYKVCVL